MVRTLRNGWISLSTHRREIEEALSGKGMEKDILPQTLSRYLSLKRELKNRGYGGRIFLNTPRSTILKIIMEHLGCCKKTSKSYYATLWLDYMEG